MTSYKPEHLEGWEFKILRATTRRFRDPPSLRAVLQEEARSGWELVEKFDDMRVRLKRRIEWRDRDTSPGIDPYRTWIGMKPQAIAWIALAVSIAFIGLVVLAASLVR